MFETVLGEIFFPPWEVNLGVSVAGECRANLLHNQQHDKTTWFLVSA